MFAETMPYFTLGDGDHLTISIKNPPKYEFGDALKNDVTNVSEVSEYKFVDVLVSVKSNGFSGSFNASFLAQDFVGLRSDFQRLQQNLVVVM